jgi:hypothetical protein
VTLVVEKDTALGEVLDECLVPFDGGRQLTFEFHPVGDVPDDTDDSPVVQPCERQFLPESPACRGGDGHLSVPSPLPVQRRQDLLLESGDRSRVVQGSPRLAQQFVRILEPVDGGVALVHVDELLVVVEDGDTVRSRFHRRHLRFELPLPRRAFGDVLKLREDTDDLVVLVGHDAIVPLTGDPLAVAADVVVDAVIPAFVFQEVRDPSVDGLPVGLRNDPLPGLPDQVRFRVAENVRRGLVGARNSELLVPLDNTEWGLFEKEVEALLSVREFPLGSVLLDSVPDAVREDGVLAGSSVFLEIVGDARRYRLTGDLLAPLAGEQDEWELRIPFPNGFEELDSVPARHVVIAHDTVDSGTEPRQSVVRTLGGLDGELLVFAFEVGSRQICEIRFVVDV